MEPIPLDGTTSLIEQQNTLQFMELAGVFLKLLTYTSSPNAGAPGQKVNMASFEHVDQEPKELKLVEVASTQNAVSVIADQLAAGRQVVFQEMVFVSGVRKQVLGFR